MTSLLLGVLVFVILLAATAVGLWVRNHLPSHHLNSESKDVIRLATAVVGTLSALALGLLIASAKTSFDDARKEMQVSAGHVVLLDRLLTHYGPETANDRILLRGLVQRRLDKGWSTETQDDAEVGIPPAYQDIEAVQDHLRKLDPSTQAQRLLQIRALEVSGMIAEGHWLQVGSDDEGLPLPFFVVMTSWLALLFGTFGLQAPSNRTVLCIILVSALSVSGAVFVIADMANPYAGLIKISLEPLDTAIHRLGQP
jgi:hypothetical protein